MIYRDFGISKYSKMGGCSAKIEAYRLYKNLSNYIEKSKNLLSCENSNEDAAVYNFNDLAIAQTLDFVPPMIDDPFIFGQISAANSLNDIFAMNGEVKTAMNILGFDFCHFGDEILSEILSGGKQKVIECGGEIIGGHTIKSSEIFYGLSVSGIVDKNNFYSNNTPKNGDLLILTKPLGAGICTTALKSKMAKFEDVKDAILSMIFLNFYALKAISEFKISAATDISGYGFLCHLCEMLGENFSANINCSQISLFKNAKKFANYGLIPDGAYKNYEFIFKKCKNLSFDKIYLCDPQTSGGLLIALPENFAYKALQNLKNAGYENACIVGEICQKQDFSVILK